MYEKFLPLPFWTLSSFSSIVQAVEILQSIIWRGRGGGGGTTSSFASELPKER